MRLLDLAFDTPQENLACDEALLDLAEEASDRETLRFWTSPSLFVVLGYSCKKTEEVHIDRCAVDRVPILRRASGGGTVLQGPGCFNYSLILRADRDPKLKTLTGTNQYVMDRNAQALSAALKQPAFVSGITDLCVNDLKFSGNAQRRKRSAVLFHGTILAGMDLDLVEKYLKPPPRQPAYRQNRSHSDFLTQISCDVSEVKKHLAGVWEANKQEVGVVHKLRENIDRLISERYGLPEWNDKF